MRIRPVSHGFFNITTLFSNTRDENRDIISKDSTNCFQLLRVGCTNDRTTVLIRIPFRIFFATI